MGAVFSAISACCCACQCCQTCLSCFRCGKSSTRARVNYFVMFVVSAFVAWILKGYGYDGLKHVGDMKHCDNDVCTGTGVVLRISLAMVLVSSLIALSVVGVSDSKNPRAFIQNDFFSFKWLLLAVTTVGCLFMSNQSAVDYGYAAAVGGGFFLFIGIVLLLEFAYTWNDSWVEKLDSSGEKFWGYMIVGCSFFMLSTSVTVWALLIQYQGGHGCTHTNTFVALTIVMSVFCLGLSLPEKIQNGAILPCSVVILYCTWICASAVVSIPQDNDSSCEALHSHVTPGMEQLMRAVGTVVTIFCVGYATIRAASSGQDLTGAQIKPDSKLLDNEQGASAEPVQAKADDDEEDTVQYNYTFFQVVYALGAMYLAMVLIDWNIKVTTHTDGQNVSIGSMSTWATVWIKMASQWATFGVYIWTLIAPFVCPNRDFS